MLRLICQLSPKENINKDKQKVNQVNRVSLFKKNALRNNIPQSITLIGFQVIKLRWELRLLPLEYI